MKTNTNHIAETTSVLLVGLETSRDTYLVPLPAPIVSTYFTLHQHNLLTLEPTPQTLKQAILGNFEVRLRLSFTTDIGW